MEDRHISLTGMVKCTAPLSYIVEFCKVFNKPPVVEISEIEPETNFVVSMITKFGFSIQFQGDTPLTFRFKAYE